MFANEVKKYAALNELAKPGGIVIFGGSADKEIPLCELRQAFSVESHLYNRSICGMSLAAAATAYDTCVAELRPETLLMHLGEADLQAFEAEPASFDGEYRDLIAHIRAQSDCRIAVVSIKNPKRQDVIAAMNRHLRYIAEAEHCEFADISAQRVWNPQETRRIIEFMHSTGFVRPLKIRQPLLDLIKILFCSQPATTD